MAVSVGHIMAVFIWHLVNVSGFKERLVKTDQMIFLLWFFNVHLHRMLYRDVMAMFLGIHLTVLVVAIPGKLSV